MKPKRRNLTRWMEARLRRLDAKLETHAPATKASPFNDFSPESMARCRDRAHELACAVQVAWGKREADKIRAAL